MNRLNLILVLAMMAVMMGDSSAQQSTGKSFTVVPLGVKGGSDESNLSCYMVAAAGSSAYICLDAGTLNYGLQKAIASGVFNGRPETILKKEIKGYFISHPHLDHVAGLVLNAPDDSSKNIYALPFCIDILKDKYFNWKSWANFADDGEKPQLKKYHYTILKGGEEIPVEQTPLFVTVFPLSHSNPYQSTAFLVREKDAYLLYLGDTGADSTEHAGNLQQLWQHIGPLIKEKKLKAIFIETSFNNEQPDKLLFGHLTPKWLMLEMHSLAGITGNNALRDFPLVITHEKPGGNREAIIKKQLLVENDLHLRLVFPVQGKLLSF